MEWGKKMELKRRRREKIKQEKEKKMWDVKKKNFRIVGCHMGIGK